MAAGTCIYWFRRDLRLEGNPALAYAASAFDRVLPVFIWSPDDEAPWSPGAASRWWLHQSLQALQDSLQPYQLSLVLRTGTAAEVLRGLVAESGAVAVVWNRLYEPALVKRDAEIKAELQAAGIAVKTFNGSLLLEPWEVFTATDKPYQVFTLSGRNCNKPLRRVQYLPSPCGLSASLKSFAAWPWKISRYFLAFIGMADWPKRGRQGRLGQVRGFASLSGMPQRSTPMLVIILPKKVSSRLSAHLHFGELSPVQIWQALVDAVQRGQVSAADCEPFKRQLGWRDFAHSLLFHFPGTTEAPLHKKYETFPWQEDDQLLRAWQEGKTGYPFVDAGMRELWHTGAIHNRVRMVAASFLVKHLLQPWQQGAKWFWDTLVDANLANNTMGWQWTAGCGADAAPYFRVFNPITQGERFDATAEYIKRWVPQLAALPTKYVHAPWAAPQSLLRDCGVELGVTYPHPIIDHREGRERALEAYAELPSGATAAPTAR